MAQTQSQKQRHRDPKVQWVIKIRGRKIIEKTTIKNKHLFFSLFFFRSLLKLHMFFQYVFRVCPSVSLSLSVMDKVTATSPLVFGRMGL